MGVGNRGDVYFRTITHGLCRYSVDASGEMERVPWENVLLASSNGLGKVEKVVINSDGTGMFAELTMPSQSLGASWRNFFGPGEKSPGTGYDHIISRIGDSGGKMYTLPRSTTMSAHGDFLWAVSREFTYITTAELQKRGLYEFLVYRVKRKEVVASFSLPDSLIYEINIDEYGRVSVEFETPNGNRMLYVRDTSNNIYTLPLEHDAAVLNVWKDRACWRTPHELAIQRLNGDIMCRVSTDPLNSFGCEYFFLFNHNNDINLALGTEEELIITPVNPDNLANDAKRWRRVSELKRETEIAAEEQARKEIEKQEAKKQRYQQLRTRLGDTLNDIKSKRQREQLEQKSVAEGSEELQAVSLAKQPEEAQPSVPAAQPSVPEEQPAVPGAQPAVPAAQPAVPAAQSAVPGVQPAVSAAQSSVPAQVNPFNSYNPYPPMVAGGSAAQTESAPHTKLARTQAIIINDIKVLRERFASGAVDKENYVKSLEHLNEELLSLHN